MTRRMLVFAASALFLTVSGGAIAFDNVGAAANDDLEYNVVYDCGGSKSKFRVLNCKGTGKLDRCDVFYINELSPGGGHMVSTYRSGIEADVAQGCKTKTNRVASVQTQHTQPPEAQMPVRTATQDAVACFASSDDSLGKTANDKNFRGVIRRLWEKEAREGMDGAVTINFENLIVGASRAWRPTATDAYSQVDPRKPIYAVRASFETCTDYRTAITKRKMERIYDCFVHKAGGWQCTQTGASGALALKDKSQYIQKKR